MENSDVTKTILPYMLCVYYLSCSRNNKYHNIFMLKYLLIIHLKKYKKKIINVMIVFFFFYKNDVKIFLK